MSNGLKRLVDRFYEEMEKEESFDLGELACLLIPELDYRIDKLEQENQWLYGKLNMIGDNHRRRKERNKIALEFRFYQDVI